MFSDSEQTPNLVVHLWLDLLIWSADNLQQKKKDLDDVNIDGERSKHVLFRTDRVLPVSYQKLCVVCQELQDTKTE